LLSSPGWERVCDFSLEENRFNMFLKIPNKMTANGPAFVLLGN